MFEPCSNHPLYTHVHSLETSGQPPPLLSELAFLPASPETAEYDLRPHGVIHAFRHAGWAPLRQRIWQSFIRTDQAQRRRTSFNDCGDHAFILQSRDDPAKNILAVTACHDRLCVPCGNARSTAIAQAVAKRLAGSTCRFVTLTLRTDAEPLAPILDRLYDAFARLKRTAFWRRHVAGGVAFLEVTRNERTGFWHPHFHVLTHGRYIPDGQLAHTWKTITKDSHVVDVRLVREREHAIRYVTKYASKPCDPKVIRHDASLDELTVALQKRRMIISFGDWRGIRLTAKPEKGKWINLGSPEEFADRASAGDDGAWAILHSALGDLANLLVAEAAVRAPPARRAELPKPEQLRFAYPEPSNHRNWPLA